MAIKTVAVMSPGDMGEGVGASIRGQGFDVVTVLAGRSDETRMRAGRAGFRDVPDLATMVSEADLILSIMPPERAESFAREIAAAMKAAGAAPIYADMNAISPMTAQRIADIVGGPIRYSLPPIPHQNRSVSARCWKRSGPTASPTYWPGWAGVSPRSLPMPAAGSARWKRSPIHTRLRASRRISTRALPTCIAS